MQSMNKQSKETAMAVQMIELEALLNANQNTQKKKKKKILSMLNQDLKHA
jgi:hypothetical protein